jgi:signal transduction histidine kinase
MKFCTLFLFVFWMHFGVAQSNTESTSVSKYKQCKTSRCKILNSITAAEYYLDFDDIDASQKWLNITKDNLNPAFLDSTSCFVHSLQSELFYYNGLFQFGKDEAQKEILTAQKIKDSLLVADGYFFLGINQFEMNDFLTAQQSFWHSRDFFPKKKVQKRIRAIIQNEHIYNNLAQVKIRLHQLDSAYWYNKRANQFAIKTNSRRGIPNTEQTFGEIYLAKKMLDSATFYFNKSIASAFKSKYYDIVVINYGYLIECHKNDVAQCEVYYNKGLALMQEHIVNTTYKKYFFTKALCVFKEFDNQKTIFIQNNIIAIDAKTKTQGNTYFQNFTDQYIRNEKKLLSLEVQKLKKQKDIVIFQLLAAILLVILLALTVMYIRRKNKINATLLNQKNEISKDLHDDIGSGISSILIHADLLQKSSEIDPKQKVLLNKISTTSKEVSQRINTFVWSLNAENNTLRDFMEYLKMYSENLFEGTPIELVFTENEDAQKQRILDGKTRKNLFFSIKEILNNALKHSGATKIIISVNMEERNNLQIIIKDNGVGIIGQNYFGNGLKNLHKRVEEMKGTITLKTEQGLTTSIAIPLSE